MSSTFLSTTVQLGASISLCLLYSAASEHMGHQVLLDLVRGRYHSPKVEDRVFMFLDMRSSTTIAEQLGHERYFDLLADYYAVMSDPIIDSGGEVYQFIGDEIVITWSVNRLLDFKVCVDCFFDIKTRMEKRRAAFMTKYGVLPDFKAGLHFGSVSTGEVGNLKKQIVFSGDVLNTTARIQSECGKRERELIISSLFQEQLLESNGYTFESLGDIPLRGKAESVSLYSVHNTADGAAQAVGA